MDPSQGSAPDAGMGNIAGAGIGAAGTLAGTLSALMFQKAARDSIEHENALDRSQSREEAELRMKEGREKLAGALDSRALEGVLGQHTNQASEALSGNQLRRGEINKVSNLLARALLSGRR